MVEALFAECADQLEQCAGLALALVPNVKRSQEGMAGEKSVIALAYHEVDGRVRVEGMQLLQDAGGQHGVA